MIVKTIFLVCLCVVINVVGCGAQVIKSIDRSKIKQENSVSTTTFQNDSTSIQTVANVNDNQGDTPQNNSTTALKSNNLIVSNDNLLFPAQGDTKSIVVHIEQGTWSSWFIDDKSLATWCHITKAGDIVYVLVDPFKGNVRRSSHFIIKSKDAEVIINVSQLGISQEELNAQAKKEEELYKKACDAGTQIAFLGYLNQYPQGKYAGAATRKIHELKGVEYYSNGDLRNAYLEFKTAGGRSSLEYANRSKYDECEEYFDFSNLSSSSDITKLISFVNRYPSGKYTISVSNWIAIVKARSLSRLSNNSQYEDALYYAKDAETRSIVETHIKRAKREKTQYAHSLKRAARSYNGSAVQFCLSPVDAMLGVDDDFIGFGYNVGVGVRFGNFRSPVQFELGAEPGFEIATDSNSGDTVTWFHMPVYARLKVNLFSIGPNAKFYGAGMGYWNAIRNNKYESDFSAGGGVGFAWRHWDWTFYYKQYVAAKTDSMRHFYIGTSAVYYF